MTISVEDFEVFCRRSFAGVLRVVDRLGDERINERPTATAGNSPFALVTHIVGACEWWVGHIVLGDESDRDRDGEFVANGSTSDLHELVEAFLARLGDRAPRLASATQLAGVPQTQVPLEGKWTVGAALLHAYEELAQHLGHLEITADLIEAETGLPLVAPC